MFISDIGCSFFLSVCVIYRNRPTDIENKLMVTEKERAKGSMDKLGIWD